MVLRKSYTYMGKLLPHFGNVTYSFGELSPLLKDPNLLTIDLEREYSCGGVGYACGRTQFKNDVKTNKHGIPLNGSRTLAVVGDAKKMNPRYIRAAYFKNYGVTIFIGIGVPIPVLDEEIAYYVSRSNEDIETELEDYGRWDKPVIGRYNYAQLGQVGLR